MQSQLRTGVAQETRTGCPAPSGILARRASDIEHHRHQLTNRADAIPRAGGAARPARLVRASFLRGFDYLLAAQYSTAAGRILSAPPGTTRASPPSPPPPPFNDNAMLNVLLVLRVRT